MVSFNQLFAGGVTLLGLTNQAFAAPAAQQQDVSIGSNSNNVHRPVPSPTREEDQVYSILPFTGDKGTSTILPVSDLEDRNVQPTPVADDGEVRYSILPVIEDE